MAPAAVLVLVASPTPAAVADKVTNNDVEQARVAEQAAQTSIGELEASLAELSAGTQEAELEALVADQRYMQSTDDLEAAKTSAQNAATAAAAAQQDTLEGSQALAQVVVDTYQQEASPFESLSPFLGATSFGDLVSADTYLMLAAERRDADLQELEALQVVAETMSSLAVSKQEAQHEAVSAAEQARSEAAAAASALREARQEAEAQRTVLIAELASRRDTTVELERQRQEQAEARQEQAQEESARRAFEAAASGAAPVGPSAGSGQGDGQAPAASAPAHASQAPPQPQAQAPAPRPAPASAPAPAPQPAPQPAPAPAPSGSGLGAQAAAIARGYVGVPYVWGGASDSGVDCSGLMMVVWARLGVRLPHFAAYQYNRGTKVPVSQMRPGDMVFFSHGGAADIHHVAMYLGNGQMIEAPRPGHSVRVAPMRYSQLLPYAVRM